MSEAFAADRVARLGLGEAMRSYYSWAVGLVVAALVLGWLPVRQQTVVAASPVLPATAPATRDAQGTSEAERDLQQARDLEAKGDLLKAIEFYRKAARALPADLGLQVEFGDKLRLATRLAPADYVPLFVQQWESVVQLHPDHMPALQRLLDSYLELCELQPSKENYAQLQRIADRIAQLDKKDTRAGAYAHIALIEGWLHGASVSDDKVSDSINRLLDIARQRPDMPRIHYIVAMADRRMGMDRIAQNLTVAGKEYFEKATGVFEEAIKAQGDNAELYYRYHNFLLAVPDRAAAHEAKIKDTITKAAQLAKPSDNLYAEMKVAHAQYLLSHNDSAGGVAVLRDLMKECPADMRVRLTLAGVLRHMSTPADRAAAIELLAMPSADDPSLVGYHALLRRRYEFRRLVDLTVARIDAYAEARDETAREAMRGDIEESYAAAERVRQISDDDKADILELQGRKVLMTGTNQAIYKAIPLLQEAYEIDSKLQRVNTDRMLLLARAYIGVRQDGDAVFLLQQIVERRPGFTAARKMLVQTLLRQGAKIDEAKAHLKVLEDAGGGSDPDLIRLRLATLDRGKDKTQIDELLAKLPEKTDEEKLNKARVLFAIGQAEKSEPLVLAARENKQYLVTATRMLVTLYYTKDPAQAQKFVEEALDRQKAQGVTEAPELRLLQAALAKRSPEEIRQLVLDVAGNPVDRALESSRQARQNKRPAEALAELRKAEQLAPDEPRIILALFQLHVEQKQWDEALKYQEKLARLNTDHMEGREYKFQLLTAQGKIVEALALAKETVEQYAPFAQSWVLLGQGQEANNQFDLAKKSYANALARQTNNQIALRGIADCCYRLGQSDEAGDYLAQLLKLAPLDAGVRMRLVSLYWVAAPEKAERLLEEAESTASLAADPTWWAWHARLVAVVRPRVALAKIQKARGLAPTNVDYLVTQAELLIAADQTDQAGKLLEQALRDPGAARHWRVHLLLAQAKLAQDKDAALVEFDAALSLATDEGSSMAVLQTLTKSMAVGEAINKLTVLAAKDDRWGILLSLLYLQRRDVDHACEAIERVLKKGVAALPAQYQPLAYRSAGTIFQLAAGQSPEKCAKYAPRAVECYASLLKILEKASDSNAALSRLTVLNNMACLYSDTLQPPDLAEAQKHSQAAYDLLEQLGEDIPELVSMRPLVLDTHGWILVCANKADKGVPLLEEAARRQPDLIDAAYHLGEAYIQQNHPDRAVGQLARAQRIIEDRQEKGQPVDEALKAKIGASLLKAKEMIKSP